MVPTTPEYPPSYAMTESSVPWKWTYSKFPAKDCVTTVSKLLFSPLTAGLENFQNWSSWYCTSIRLEDMGIALETVNLVPV